MIEIKPKEKKEVPEKAVQAVRQPVPFYLQDSSEVDWIRQKIQSNKDYLSRCTSKSLYQKVEKDTMYLQNVILPILQAKTNMFYNDAARKFINYLDSAIQNNCNALTVYYPINDNYQTEIKVGIGNCRQNKKFGTLGAVDVYIELVSMEANEVPFSTILLENNIG